MTEAIRMQLGFIYTDANTSSVPDAKRASFSPVNVVETDAQHEAGLMWDQCFFCHGFVLIDVYRHTHERCNCGARRVSAWPGGWTKDGETWMYSG